MLCFSLASAGKNRRACGSKAGRNKKDLKSFLRKERSWVWWHVPSACTWEGKQEGGELKAAPDP